jgi:hypothetical protein
MSTHRYSSGVFHNTPPGEAIPCCDAPRDDPIHTHEPPPRFCTCEKVLGGRRHYWSPMLGCPA